MGLESALGTLALSTSDFSGAMSHFDKASELCREIGYDAYLCVSVTYHALASFASGRTLEARDELTESLPMLKRVEVPYGHAFTAVLGALEAELDHVSEGAELVESVVPYFAGENAALGFSGMVPLCRGFVELAHARRALDRGDAPAAERHRQLARDCLELGRGTRAKKTSAEVDVLASLLELRLDERPDPQRPISLVLEVAEDGRFFVLPDGRRVGCARRPVMARILLRLARAHVDRPGNGVRWEALLEAGWPGVRIYQGAARNRVRVMISRMRELGLRSWLHGGDEGYAFRPELEVRFVE